MPVWTAFGVKSRISVAARVAWGWAAADVLETGVDDARARATTGGRRGHRGKDAGHGRSPQHRSSHQPGQDRRSVEPGGGYVEWAARMRRRVTFSRNLTLSLSRTCRCYCKYCAFATHKPHLHSPDEVLGLLDRAVSRHHVKELLVLTGEKPEVNAEVARRLAEYGHADFTSYVVWVCERALERGLAAAHEPRRARARGPGAVARGHRVAGPDARVVSSRGSRSSTPAPRPSIRRAGSRRSRLRASCRSRSPAGSSSGSARPRKSGSRRSRCWPSCTRAMATSRR